MPITLNNSNISIQYNTGSNYIIETVKSDLYVRDNVGTTSNLFAEPTVSPTLTSNLAVFTHSGGAENQTPHTIYFPENTVCDILIIGGGGGGSAGGGGGGGYVYLNNISLSSGTYTVTVGNGGTGGATISTNGNQGGNSSFIGGSLSYTAFGGGGGGGNTNLAPAHTTGQVGSYGGNGHDQTTTQTYTSTQGNRGGRAIVGSSGSGGGGGGAGAIGGDAVYVSGLFANAARTTQYNKGGQGGNGIANAITGTSIFYAGGGTAGANTNFDTDTSTQIAPLGGGGIGARANNANGGNGTDGLGGGGGGGDWERTAGTRGGSGVVIIKVISPTTNKYLFFNYLSTQTNYTLTFPVRTLVDVNNNNNLILQGQYNVSLGTANSSIIPSVFNTSNRLIPLPNTSTSNISVRYHLLNPIKTAEGAQWTYSSSNTNVYHLGSVGIGTTNPEYSLDVRGFIYSSSGGYTSSALTKWSVLSDRRIKENIVKASYDKCLENVKNIELYNFNFKDNYVNTNDRHQLGFIAQEVQQVYPKAVEVSRMIMNLEEKIDDLLTLNTTQIDYTLYGAVKCLIQKLENIKIKMEQIKTVYNITT